MTLLSLLLDFNRLLLAAHVFWFTFDN